MLSINEEVQMVFSLGQEETVEINHASWNEEKKAHLSSYRTSHGVFLSVTNERKGKCDRPRSRQKTLLVLVSESV